MEDQPVEPDQDCKHAGSLWDFLSVLLERFESDTPAGKMQFQMMALVGEFERNTIAQNVKMGMKAKARAGEWYGGTAPLGYHWVPIEGTENSSRKKSRLEMQ